MSNALANQLIDNKKPKNKEVSSTVSVPPDDKLLPDKSNIDINDDPIFQIYPEFAEDDISNEEIIKVGTQIENENKEPIPVTKSSDPPLLLLRIQHKMQKL